MDSALSATASIGQLRWRCRRGTKELDRILGGFLNDEYEKAPIGLKKAFATLLDEQDPDISSWLFDAKEPIASQYKKLIEILQRRYIQV